MLTIYSKNTSFKNNQGKMYFDSLGYGVLKDLYSDPLITEELNGSYILEFEYKIDGVLNEYLIDENIIKANGQPFVIYDIKKDTSKISILAKHWILNEWTKDFLVDVAPTNLNSQNALKWIQDKGSNQVNISVNGDCENIASARYVRKNIINAIFNEDNALLTRFGGELSYDKDSVFINKKRGSFSGITIRERKNLSGIEFHSDFSTVATRLLPLGKDGLMLDSIFVDSPIIDSYSTPVIKKVEIDSDNQDELHDYCQTLFENDIDKPTISIKIDFIELSKTTEYSKYSNLESIHLGDTVLAYIPSLDLNIKTRVVKTVYNCNLKRITSLELGTCVPNIAFNNVNIQNDVNKIVNEQLSFLAKAKSEASDLMKHPFDGYIFLDENQGCLYIADNKNLSEANDVWKWGLGGLGFSSTGINGPYETAITQDGKIVADFITTGKLNTNVIEGYGSLTLQVKSNTDGLTKTNTNLSNLSNTVDTLSDDIDGVSADFEDFKDNEYIQSIDNLQKQIDGAIQFWNGAEIPTLENYPTNDWTTENDKINHQADIYTVIQDVEGEMKQGKSYRFDKIDGVWQWIELTDNELSAVQSLAQEALNKSKLNATDISTIKNNVSKLEQTDREIKASVSSTENRVNILEKTVEIYSIDLDLYNLTIPVNTENKPIETKLYEIGYYAYYKGKQVTPTIISKSTADGIDVSTTNGKIHLSVNQNNTISNINNELVFEFHYTVDGIANIISKKIIAVLAQQGPQGLQGPQGIQGIQGIQGVKGEDGISTYFYIRYSANANGSSMTTAPQSDTQYMGVASTTSPTAPTSSSGYTWSKIKGEQGEQGEQGIPGQIGESGKTSYLHIKYSEDGTTFTPADGEYKIGEKPSRWQGTYVDFNENDSTIFSDYKWVDTAIVVEDLVTPTNTVSGPNIHIEDASDKKMVNFEIEGKSEQETRSGKNLFNKNKAMEHQYIANGTEVSNRYSLNSNEDIIISYSNYTHGRSFFNKMTLEAGTYTLSFITSTSGENKQIMLSVRNMETLVDIFSPTNLTIVDGTKYSIQFILSATTTIGISINPYIKETGTLTLEDIQLELGDIATDYEPYGISPSPDYHSEIESVGYRNLVEETLTGMNINNSGQITRASFDMFIAKVEKDKTYTISVDDITGVVCGFFTSKPTLYSISYNDSRLIQEGSMTIIAPITGYIAFRGTSGYQYAQLTEGTQAHSYIPYGKYGVEVKNAGKNSFNLPNQTLTYNGLTVSVVNNVFNLSGTLTSPSTFHFNSNFTLSAGTYTINLYSNSNYPYIILTSNGVKVAGTAYSDKGKKTFTLTEDVIIDDISLYFGNTSVSYLSSYKVQLEKGTELTGYEEYKSNTSLFVLNQPLRSLPNGVKDIAYIKNNILYVDRKVGSKVFDGSNDENWEQSNNTSYSQDYLRFQISIIGKKKNNGIDTIKDNIYSNNFTCKILNGNSTRQSNSITGQGANSNINIFIDKNIIGGSTLSNFKTWLSTHNTQVDYELAEPYTEEIGEVEIPSTFKGVNNITTTDELEPVMNIEYIRDTILSDYVEGQVSNAVAIQERKNAEFQITNEEIKSTVSAISTNLDGTKSSLKSVEEKITSQEKTIKIISKNIDSTTGNITEVTTTNGFTFNSNGLKIYIDENSYNTVIDNVGTYYKDGDAVINQTTKDGSILTNLSEKGQTKYSYNENDDYDFIEERIESDGEYAYATFYNGEE